MKAGEALPYLKSLEADLAAESDPQLRSWYETEIALTPDHKDAVKIQTLLGEFRDGLACLVDKALDDQPAVAETEQQEIETEYPDRILNTADEEVWLSPEDKKQKSVLLWLKNVATEYENDMHKARLLTKRSKREKCEAVARNKFARQFARFDGTGEKPAHIVYDGEALGFVLDDLQESKPELADVATTVTVEYMHKHGLEFAKDSSSFAELFHQSVSGRPSAERFDKILAGIYEGQNFIINPQVAVELHIALAHAFFETKPHSNLDFHKKIIETSYMHTDVIDKKTDFMTALDTTIAAGIRIYSLKPLMAEFFNARLVFSGGRYAYLHQHEQYYDESRKFISVKRSKEMIAKFTHALASSTYSRETLTEGEEAFLERSGTYDPFEIFSIDTRELISDGPSKYTELPEYWKEAFTGCALYAKRQRYLAPRSQAHDLLHTTLNKETETPFYPHIIDIPISPGLSISLTVVLGGEFHDQDVGLAADGLVKKLVKGHDDLLREDYLRRAGEPVTRMGWLALEALSFNDDVAYAVALLRPSVPEDLKQVSDPYMALVTTYGEKVFDDLSEEESSIHNRIDAKRIHIKNERHNYLGRRPIQFRLPDEYQKRGLEALLLRQHPDRKHIVVIAKHREGDITFTYNNDLVNTDKSMHASVKSSLALAFDELVISLMNEWACRPVIETSEGTVRKDDSKSKVNLGFLRYLPEGFKFSEQQRKVFKDEQHGDLTFESMRRKAQDPTGLARNSTYVREAFDSSKPPLEVYYDPRIIRDVTTL